MTHPFHPEFGREYDAVECRTRGLGGYRAYYYNDERQVVSIRFSWTSLAPEDPFVVASAGRAAFRIKDLLRLSALLDALRGKDR